MSAEASNIPLAQLTALAAAVELTELRPLAFGAQLARDAPALGSALDVRIENDLSSKQESDGQFVVLANFKIGASPEANAKEQFLEIRYSIIGRYRVPPEHPLNQDVLDLFAKTNGMVHLWPYLRAFVANACAQMGLLPITLPPFRVQQASEKPPRKSDSAAP